MEKLTRRNFLKLSTAGAGGGCLLLAAGLGPAEGATSFRLRKPIGESQTICPYCSCGCGLVIATDEEGHVTNCEGDPDHITNRGALDPKSIAVPQLLNSPLRLHTIKYRAPGSAEWEEKSWDWTISTLTRADQEDARLDLEGHRRCQRQAGGGQPHRRARLAGRRRHQQRGLLPRLQVHAITGGCLSRTSGTHMTLGHGGRSGRLIRSRCHDE